MLLDWFYNLWPLKVPSAPFCDFEVGDLFQEKSGVYKLIERNAFEARVVHWNRWTRLWWGKNTNGNGRKIAN